MTFAADIDAGNPPQTGYLQFQQLNAAELSIEAARPDATDLLVALSDISVEASSEEEIGAVKFGRLMISAPELTVWDVSVEGIQKTVLDQILTRVFTGKMISDRQSSTIETLPFERVQIAALGNEHVSISNIALDVHTNDAGQFVGFTLPPTETLIRISPGLFQSLRALGVLPEGVLTDADTPIPAQVRAKFRHDPVTGEDSLDDTSISIDGLAEIEFSARMKGVTPIFLFGLGLSDEFRFRVEDMTFISTINDDGWLLHLLRDRGLYRPQLLAVMRAIGGQDLAEEDLQSFARDPGKASIEVTAERFGSLETLLRDLIANQGSADMGLTLTVSASLEPTED